MKAASYLLRMAAKAKAKGKALAKAKAVAKGKAKVKGAGGGSSCKKKPAGKTDNIGQLGSGRQLTKTQSKNHKNNDRHPNTTHKQ